MSQVEDDMQGYKGYARRLLTVYVEARGMGGGACSVGRRAGVGAPVRRPYACQVHVTHHRAAHAHVLPHHQPAARRRVAGALIW